MNLSFLSFQLRRLAPCALLAAVLTLTASRLAAQEAPPATPPPVAPAQRQQQSPRRSTGSTATDARFSMQACLLSDSLI